MNQRGGAEEVLVELRQLFPSAPIYTSIAAADSMDGLGDVDLRTSRLDAVPFGARHHHLLLPLYPLVWGRTRLHGYDLVVSNKSAFCHGVDTGSTLHVCYCLTPTRFVWDAPRYLRHEALPPGGRLVLKVLLPWLRAWDRRAAAGVDAFVAISTAVRDRIAAVYGRGSEVIHPPVATERFAPGPDGDYHLVLSRLIPYKRIDLAVAAFNKLGRRLLIVGDGRDRRRLEAMAGPTVEFRGRQPAEEAARLLGSCRGLVWPGEEDFGMAPVEAMASGRPVIARRAGGAVDTVVPGFSGVFFHGDSPEELAAAVEEADAVDWDRAAIRSHAQLFSRSVFRRRLSAFLEEVMADRQAGKR
ncbi:MAG: glycosyltransferase [Anaerolineae bacterium]